MTGTKKTTTRVGKEKGKGNLLALLGGVQMVRPFWKTAGRFLTKLNAELPFDPAICFWVFIRRKWKH